MLIFLQPLKLYVQLIFSLDSPRGFLRISSTRTFRDVDDAQRGRERERERRRGRRTLLNPKRTKHDVVRFPKHAIPFDVEQTPPFSFLSQLSTIKEVCVCIYMCVCVCVCMRALIPAHLPRGYARFLPPLEKKKAREEVIASPPSPPSTSGDLLLSLFLVRSRYRRLEMQKRLWKSNRITLFFWDLIKSSSLSFEPKGDIFSPGFFLSSPCLPQPSRPNAIIDGVISSLDKFIYTTISRLLVPRF